MYRLVPIVLLAACAPLAEVEESGPLPPALEGQAREGSARLTGELGDVVLGGTASESFVWSSGRYVDYEVYTLQDDGSWGLLAGTLAFDPTATFPQLLDTSSVLGAVGEESEGATIDRVPTLATLDVSERDDGGYDLVLVASFGDEGILRGDVIVDPAD